MRVRHLIPALECENDVGGRFTKLPPFDSQRPWTLSLLLPSICVSVLGPPVAERAKRGWTGATPISANWCFMPWFCMVWA